MGPLDSRLTCKVRDLEDISRCGIITLDLSRQKLLMQRWRQKGDVLAFIAISYQIDGREIISQKIPTTAPKAGKPNANQIRNSV